MVLILVLVDVGLGRGGKVAAKITGEVLILVLVDVGLGLTVNGGRGACLIKS